MAVATDTITFDSFYTSTIKNYSKELQKNFLEYRPGVNVLMDEYGHQESGSYAVQIPLEYGGTSPNVTVMQPYDTIGTNPTEYSVPGIFKYVVFATSATVSEIEKVMNSGKAKLFDLLEGRIRHGVRELVNAVNSEIYSDGTSYGGNSFQGLAAGVSTTPTSDPSSGAIGGVSVTTYPWFQNNATTSCGSFAANGVKGSATDKVIAGFDVATDGEMDRPNCILSDQTVFEYYNNTLLSTVRYIDPLKKGDLSFGGLYYQDMPWYWDRNCPSGRMYILNSKYIHFYVDPLMMFRWSESRTWPNQLVDIRILSLRLALVYKARMFATVLDGWTA